MAPTATLSPALANWQLRAAVLALCSSLTLAAAAQTATPAATDAAAAPAPEAPASNQVLPPVVVKATTVDTYTVRDTSSATKLTLSPRETPQSLTVMTRERLDDQRLTSLREVLDNTPGIYSNQYDTERVLFYARGFLIDTLMYDGVPTHTNFSTSSIDETLDTALYDRIEIVRGATGLMTGAGSPAASVNLVRKHADSKVPAYSFSLSGGSWNNGRVDADVTVPLNADASVRARFVGAAETTDSYQNLYHKDQYVLAAIVDADLSPDTRVSLGMDYQDNRPTSVTWGSFPLFLSDGSLANWPRSVSTSTDWAYWNRKTTSVFGEVRHEFDNGWKVQGTLSHREFKEDVALFYVSGYPDAATGLGLSPWAYRSKGDIKENSVDVHATGPFEWLGRKHELVAGYNGSREKNVGTEQAFTGTLADTGNFFEWNGSYAEPQWADSTPVNNIRTNQDAVYVAGRFSLADPLKLIAGARWNRWSIDSYYVYDETPNNKYDLTKVIPYAGLVWDILPQFSAFTSVTGIFKPQSKRDATGGYLDPVEGRSFEVGIKGEHFDRRLNTAFTVFETRQNNVAAAVLDENGDPVLLPDGSAVSTTVDGTRTRGFEFEANGQISPNLKASFGWTRYLTKDGNGQQIRAFLPSTMVRAFATWEPRNLVDGLALGAGINWQSATQTTVGSPNGAYLLRQGSVSLVNLMARYAFSPSLSVQLNANNVFDKKYYVLDEYDNTYYGAPASYTASLRFTY